VQHEDIASAIERRTLFIALKGGIMDFAAGQKFAAAEYFRPLVEAPVAEFVREAERIERTAKIEDHEFFRYGKNSASALVLWASQEAVVTNPFSQILFKVIGISERSRSLDIDARSCWRTQLGSFRNSSQLTPMVDLAALQVGGTQ
jgi:hypothetical protein